jgi:hypothetical protein
MMQPRFFRHLVRPLIDHHLRNKTANHQVVLFGAMLLDEAPHFGPEDLSVRVGSYYARIEDDPELAPLTHASPLLERGSRLATFAVSDLL